LTVIEFCSAGGVHADAESKAHPTARTAQNGIRLRLFIIGQE
jgi:hypothetical protein